MTVLITFSVLRSYHQIRVLDLPLSPTVDWLEGFSLELYPANRAELTRFPLCLNHAYPGL